MSTLDELKDYLVEKPKPLLGAVTIQLLIFRELLDYTVFRTEDSREVNAVDTPLSISDRKTVKRVAFLGSKQKAVESRELEAVLRTALASAKLKQKECWLKDKLCLECPRCALYGATALSKAPNIRHRIEYSTAFSLLTYDLLHKQITFNAVDEKTQRTDSAFQTRHVVRPASLFPSIVTLRSVTRNELVLAVKTLLSSKSYGAETRIGGDCRNSIRGVVAGWEEIITPLELTLELYDKRDNLGGDVVSSVLEQQYKSQAGNPDRVRVLSASQVQGLVSECAAVPLDENFLNSAFGDAKDYRAAQGK